MDIPRYPEFRDLILDDKTAFDAAFQKFPPRISEFTFTNLYSWRKAYRFKAALCGEFLIVRSDAGARPAFFEPIGEGDKKVMMLNILRDTGGNFMRVPEETARAFAEDPGVVVEEDTDNFDYVYATSDLVNLQGEKYDGKRNLIRQFSGRYRYEYARLDHATIGECLAFEERWCGSRDCDSVDGLRNERQAIREMSDNCLVFGLIAGGIRIDNEIVALAVAEPLNPRTLVMHVLKADPNITGLYQAIMRDFLKREAGAFEYVNLEQDLGVPGLRKSKLSYHPVSMIKKYTVSLKHKEER